MIARAMVTFAIVLDHQLPVALLHDRALMRNLGPRCGMRRDIGCHAVGVPVEIGRIVGQAHEYLPGDIAQCDRLERVSATIEIIGHRPCRLQLAVEPVGPVVIAARQQRSTSARRLAQPGAAMAADIVKSPQFAAPVTHDDDRRIEQVERYKRSGLAQLAFGCRKHPGSGKQLFVSPVDQCRGEKRRRQAVSAPPLRDQIGKLSQIAVGKMTGHGCASLRAVRA